jgi:hypothetical protein
MPRKKATIRKKSTTTGLENLPPTAEALEEFEEVWKPLLCDGRGRLVRDRVIKKLYDYSFMLDQVPRVYMEVTGGRLSKPNHFASTIISEANDYQNEVWEETLADEKKRWEEERGSKVDDVCYVRLGRRTGLQSRNVEVTTSEGKYLVTWHEGLEVVFSDESKPLPEHWTSTVVDAIKTLLKHF